MTLFLILLFSTVGGGYVLYGRRQHDAMYLVTGVALMIYPYFIDGAILIVIVGLLIAAIPIARARGLF